MTTANNTSDLLIVGAGPTGLAAALDARRHGLSVRIVERRAERADYSKALVVHARTMEVFERLGCAAEVRAAGAQFRALHVHTRPGKNSTRVDLIDRNWGDTRYPFWLSVTQYEVERVLEHQLRLAGVHVEWNTTLVGLQQEADRVTSTLQRGDGAIERHDARWLLGCDGGRSSTRDLIEVRMDRTELGVSFALADVTTDSELPSDEGHVVWADEGLLLIVPMPAPGVWRLIAQVGNNASALDAEGWNRLVQRRALLDLKIRSMGWNSQFALTSGVSATLRRERVFLLGDAAHVHSPVGGQGLNTGVQDAHNLVWKLALSDNLNLPAEMRESLLDSYARERHAVAVAMVRATERMTRVLTGRHPLLFGLLRRLAPLVIRRRRIADKLGRGVGMLDLLTDGQQRLPNPELPTGRRLYDHVDPLLPTALVWRGQQLIVRPDRVIARAGTLLALRRADLDRDGGLT